MKILTESISQCLSREEIGYLNGIINNGGSKYLRAS